MSCCELIRNLLNVEKYRATAAVALNHKWIRSFADLEIRKKGFLGPLVAKSLLVSCQLCNPLRHAMLLCIAAQIPDRGAGIVRRAFVALDKTCDAKLSSDEIYLGLKGTVPTEVLDEIILKAQENGGVKYNGIIYFITGNT